MRASRNVRNREKEYKKGHARESGSASVLLKGGECYCTLRTEKKRSRIFEEDVTVIALSGKNNEGEGFSNSEGPGNCEKSFGEFVEEVVVLCGGCQYGFCVVQVEKGRGFIVQREKVGNYMGK